MSEFGQSLKNLVVKSFETIGSTAGNIAASAMQKVETYNLSNQLKDLYAALGEKVYALSGKGTEFPEDLAEDLKHIAAIEAELKQRNEQKETAPEAAAEPAAVFTASEEEREAGTAAAEFAAKDNHDVPVIEVEEDTDEDSVTREDCPLSTAISDLFAQMPPVDKMVDKVNSSLDELGDNLRKFSGDFDRQLKEFSDQMMGKDDPE